MVADTFIMLLELLAHGKLTAQQLSERLEVSERTVSRYIDVLSASGIPVVSNKGKGGGISIGSDYRLTSALFDKAELQYIVAAIEAFSSPTVFREKVLLKLNSMRPSAGTSGFANEDFAVDFSDAPQGDAFGAKLDALSAAKKARKAVEICYHNRRGDISERVIEPYIFVYNNGNWYVFARCRREDAMRMFKLSRVTHIVPTNSDYVIPPRFERSWDLADPTKKQKIHVVLHVGEKARYDVEEWLGLENVRKTEKGYTARGDVFDNETTFAKLLSFGDAIEIESPKSLAEKIRAAHESAARR